MIHEDGFTELRLDQLPHLAPFVVVVDESLRIAWVSERIASRTRCAVGRHVSELVISEHLPSTEAIAGDRTRHKMTILSAHHGLPVVGQWFTNRDGFTLMAYPDLGNTNDIDQFSFDDFSEKSRAIELLITREEHAATLQEARAAALSLRDERDFTQTLFNTTQVLVLVLDSDGKIIRFNRQMSILSGYDLSDVRGKDCFDIFVPADNREARRERFANAKPGELPKGNVTPILTKDGREIPIEWYDNVLTDHQGNPRGMLAVGLDISMRVKLQSQLTHAQKLEAVGQLSAGIAHEINTPAQFISDSIHFLQEAFEDLKTLHSSYCQVVGYLEEGEGNADLIDHVRRMEQRADLPYLGRQIPESLERCVEGVARITDIVQALKEFARTDAHQKSPVDINRAIRSTLTIARGEYSHFADTETNLGEIDPVVCNSGDINQVLLHLIVNGAHSIAEVVKTTGERGMIRIRTAQETRHVRIEVEDNGTGIPKSIEDKIFDPFFSTKDVGKGRGQGLALARSIVVDQHRGTLTFESVEGKGSTFVIRLPTDDTDTADSESVL